MSTSRFNDDAMAKAYQELLLPLVFEPWGRLLLDRAGLKPGDQVLDVATGPGTLARQAALVVGPQGKVTGVDYSPQMLARAQEQAPVSGGASLDYLVADAAALPFPDGQFDVVLCQQGLQFFPDQLGCLKEMKRVLKPGGRLALALWSDKKAMTLFVAFLEAVDATLPEAPPRAALGFLDVAKLDALLRAAGFSDPTVAEETLVADLQGGLAQALECAQASTASASIRGMNPEQRTRFEGQVAGNLKPWTQGSVIQAPARALVATARGALA
jgi:SAM-dependent methyltransferase